MNLEGIVVNGKLLSIDPKIYASTNTQGTIVYCGTTLAYLAEQAYDPFVNLVSS